MSELNRIPSSSLRIGNYVHNVVLGKDQRITAAGIQNMDTEQDFAHIRLTGIILTPGWCELLGGEYWDDSGVTAYKFSIPDDVITIRFIDGRAVYYYTYSSNQSVKMWFVHQLQNLFYALSGGAELLLLHDRPKNTEIPKI